MTRADELLLAYEDITWEAYVDLTDNLVAINRADMDRELAHQPSLFSYYVGLQAVAKKRLDESNTKLAQAMATTRNRLDQEARGTGKKLPAATLDSLVTGDIMVTDLQHEVDNRVFKYTLMKGLVSALEQKATMLVQLSANGRAETKLYN